MPRNGRAMAAQRTRLTHGLPRIHPIRTPPAAAPRRRGPGAAQPGHEELRKRGMTRLAAAFDRPAAALVAYRLRPPAPIAPPEARMSIRYFKRFRMEIDLPGPPPPALPAGYRLLPWDDGLLEAHAAVKFACFHEEI